MDRTHLRAWGGRLFLRAFEFGFLALLWGPPSFQGWNLALRSLDFPPCAAIYCPLVLFSLLFLGFSVWRLVRRFEELRVCGCSRCSKGSEEPVVDTIGSPKWGYRNCNGREGVSDLLDESEEEEGDEDGKEEEGDDGDEVMKLRKVIRAKAVRELEKERIAAASAAEEAMAKIFWLQNEKNFVEREARQYREIAEQKKAYDQQYIEQLQWHIEKLESEKRGDSSRWAEDRGYGE
ncbi:protein FLOURY 1-like isoform X2 [Phoenix dactylifera]|nr:protein FLOURY 1-like isoform X2 [Phoenix dactylifera]